MTKKLLIGAFQIDIDGGEDHAIDGPTAERSGLSSGQTLVPPETPLSDEASQGKKEDRRLMPEGHRPIFNNGRFPVWQIAGEFFQLVQSNYFTAGFFGDGFQQGAVG